MADKLALGAALERLAAREEATWQEDAQMVVDHFQHLSSASIIQGGVAVRYKSDDESFTGQAPGLGNVTIREPSETKTQEKTFGIDKQRIGKFRIWKHGPGVIAFHRYEFSDPMTPGLREAPDTLFLEYGPKTRRVRRFGIPHTKVLKIFFIHVIYARTVETIFQVV